MPLLLVATPIGNLQDITLRAIAVLREAHVIACEDTRRTRRLLEAHGIAGKRLVSCHEHNEARRASELLGELAAGQTVALVTNAGTPLVSDPGYRLVAAAIAAGVEVIPIPGPCAAIAALSAAGLPAHAFTFLGFPPKGPGRLRNFLAAERSARGTLILYESPQRLRKLLAASVAVFGGERRAAVCRELTKIHEQIRRGTLAELAECFAGNEKGGPAEPVRGEIVVLIAPGQKHERSER